jgi:hypothetical protein
MALLHSVGGRRERVMAISSPINAEGRAVLGVSVRLKVPKSELFNSRSGWNYTVRASDVRPSFRRNLNVKRSIGSANSLVKRESLADDQDHRANANIDELIRAA